MAKPVPDEAVTELREQIRKEIACGFYPVASIIDSVVEMFSDDVKAEELEPLARRLTREAVADHEREAVDWPKVTDCDRLDAAFAELTRAGVVCRQNFTCCRTCGFAEIGAELDEERSRGVNVRGCAFYHMQNTESAVEGYGLYIAYRSLEEGDAATARVAHEISDALARHGLRVEWNGDPATCVKVELDWKRRRPD